MTAKSNGSETQPPQPQQLQRRPPRPLFLYGTLRALPLLAWALTGDASKVGDVERLVQPARVRGYTRFGLRGRDYPAAVPVEHAGAVASASASVVDGLLLRPQTRSQRAKLDDFEGETYRVVPVTVEVDGAEAELEMVDADIYVWNGAADDVSAEEWDFEAFVRDRLDHWLELFGGIELVGDDSDDDDTL